MGQIVERRQILFTQFTFGSDGANTAMLLLPFLGAAVFSDLLTRRVPNALVALMLLTGLIFQLATASSLASGLLMSFGGAGVGFLILLPFYALGGMGAGDVKLLAASGSFLGLHGALIAGVCTLVAGTVLGLLVLGFRVLRAASLARRPDEAIPAEPAAPQLPYSLAISVGALTAVTQW
ncbi:MAG: hypothetical protein HKN84_12990 [Gammaproteobacteria bacterium]|nr:hypothetical protein [Gammaproteobacteria bacterium]